MAVLFPSTSRYSVTPVTTLVRADGTIVTYLTRRIVPQPERFAFLHWHTVMQGERLDQIAASELGDSEQFWKLCDANRALRPESLTETVGRRLRMTLPEGIPGIPNA